MTHESLKVMLVEDDEDDYILTRDLLAEIKSSRFDLTWASTYEEALAALNAWGPELCLIDYRLGQHNGIELMREIYARGYRIPIILLTGQDDRDLDLMAMKAGAADYLIKGQISRPLLERTIRYTLERARTLEALLASENKYRQIVETATEGIWMLDAEARTSFANQRIAAMLGYTVEEMLGRSLFDFVAEDDRPVAERNMARRQQGIADQHEFRFRRKDGTDLWTLISTNSMRGADGEYIGALGMISDITERKRAEDALRRNELRLAEIIKAQQDIAASDLDLPALMTLIAERTREITNAAGVATLEFIDGDEMVYRAGCGIGSSYIGLKLKLDSSFAGLAVRTGKVLHCADSETDPRVHLAMSKQFGIRSMIAAPLYYNQQIIGVLKVLSPKPHAFTDQDEHVLLIMSVTLGAAIERKRSEVAMAASRDVAVESVRLKSEFLANMSHEIRTPMNGVIGMTGLLLDTPLDDQQRDFTETIRSSADSLLTIINDILDFSKIEAGHLEFETLDFDLRHAVEGAVELLAERARAKQLELTSLVYADVPVDLRGDPGRLRQILTNLIGNAIKFTQSGEVTVSVSKASEDESHSCIRFEVSDTGIGISPESQRKLFQAFSQADGSTTRKYGGTGLGLAISKQLVELMEGEIGVESVQGVGSTFWFTIRMEKQSPNHLSGEKSSVALKGLRALVVDDNPTNRRILIHQTNSWGMLCEEADSGLRAIEMLRAAAQAGHPYDMTVLDLQMPGMDGFELARAIKSDPGISDTRLVMMTSFSQRGHGALAREAGISAYLTKPVRQSQLCESLAIVMNKAAAADPSRRDAVVRSEIVTRHTIEELEERSQLRILIAEDHVVNQKLAKLQVEKLGYRVDVVANGLEVLEALKRIPYILILMDCQMPEMDGYEATAEIRRREGTARHTPIIALTANAMEGDRETCLAVGMDDFITKPVRQKDLAEAIERWAGGTSPAAASRLICEKGTNESARSEITWRLEELEEEFGSEVVMELRGTFLLDIEVRLKKLRLLVEAQDETALAREAHALKGSCGNLGALQLAELCRQLERQGREHTFDKARSTLSQLEELFRHVQPVLKMNSSRQLVKS